MKHLFLSLAASAVLLAPLSGLAAPVTIVNVNGDTAADIRPHVDAFRNALGPNNGNAPVNADPNGRRQINWDAAPDAISDPNPFPGDFFNANVNPRARGIEFREVGATTGFQLSSTAASGEPVAFGVPTDFVPFSPERLFTPVGGNEFDVLFFDPATQTRPATSRGLGVVFSDVETANTTSMSFFNLKNELLLKLFATPGNDKGFSFLGAIFDAPEVARVRFDVGTRTFDGDRFRGRGDSVVMDDFIFGEPIPAPVPLPAPIALMASGLIALFGMRWRAKQRA